MVKSLDFGFQLQILTSHSSKSYKTLIVKSSSFVSLIFGNSGTLLTIFLSFSLTKSLFFFLPKTLSKFRIDLHSLELRLDSAQQCQSQNMLEIYCLNFLHSINALLEILRTIYSKARCEDCQIQIRSAQSAKNDHMVGYSSEIQWRNFSRSFSFCAKFLTIRSLFFERWRIIWVYYWTYPHYSCANLEDSQLPTQLTVHYFTSIACVGEKQLDFPDFTKRAIYYEKFSSLEIKISIKIIIFEQNIVLVYYYKIYIQIYLKIHRVLFMKQKNFVYLTTDYFLLPLFLNFVFNNADSFFNLNLLLISKF